VAALVLFIALAFAHVLALMHLVNPPMGVLAAAAPLILFGQIVSILGLKGGSLKTQGSTRAFGRQWRLALRYIPNGWKIFGLPFWYAYVPVTFVYGMARAGGSVEEVAGKLVLTEHGRVIRALTEQEAFSSRADMFAGFSVILMAFAFAHFVLLRFVVPNRDAIIAERAP
jgi:hypothetical protein